MNKRESANLKFRGILLQLIPRHGSVGLLNAALRSRPETKKRGCLSFVDWWFFFACGGTKSYTNRPKASATSLVSDHEGWVSLCHLDLYENELKNLPAFKNFFGGSMKKIKKRHSFKAKIEKGVKCDSPEVKDTLFVRLSYPQAAALLNFLEEKFKIRSKTKWKEHDVKNRVDKVKRALRNNAGLLHKTAFLSQCSIAEKERKTGEARLVSMWKQSLPVMTGEQLFKFIGITKKDLPALTDEEFIKRLYENGHLKVPSQEPQGLVYYENTGEKLEPVDFVPWKEMDEDLAAYASQRKNKERTKTKKKKHGFLKRNYSAFFPAL